VSEEDADEVITDNKGEDEVRLVCVEGNDGEEGTESEEDIDGNGDEGGVIEQKEGDDIRGKTPLDIINDELSSSAADIDSED